ncbi:GNAT family N-acetyltransferase [uncultured Clostridium sp.]|uniref:GNAT family N-acetyltransferase n=1 Tax=uncultured Clostridium sp. TaxID=59620 RepID=UPI0032178BA6
MIKKMRIETNRLVIRPYIENDLLESFQLMQNKELFKYLDMEIMSFEEYKGLFKWLIDSYKTGFEDDFKYSFAIFLKDTGKFIGWCCSGPSDELPNPNREIAYTISKYHRNKGYTTQAAQGLIKYLLKKTNVDVLDAMALTHNGPSNRIIQKCGFRYVNNIKVGEREFYCYKLRKSQLQNENK